MNFVKQSGVGETTPTHITSTKHVSAKQHKSKQKEDSTSFAGAVLNAMSPAVIQQDAVHPTLHKAVGTSFASHVKGLETPLHGDVRAIQGALQESQGPASHSNTHTLSTDKTEKTEATVAQEPTVQAQAGLLKSQAGLVKSQAEPAKSQADSAKSKQTAVHGAMSALQNTTLAKSPAQSLNPSQVIHKTQLAVSAGTQTAKHDGAHTNATSQVPAPVSPYSILHSVSAGSVQAQAHTNTAQVLNLHSPTAYHQFAQAVAQQLSGHQSRVSVRVEPEGLGPIVVHVHEQAGQLNIRVEATHLQTMQWFHAERQNLLGHLAESGHAVQNMEISFSNSFSQSGQGGTSQSQYSSPQAGGLRSDLSHSTDSGVSGSSAVGQDVRRWYV